MGIVSKDWRTASIVPVLKKGDKSNAANHRPVSLTAICSQALVSFKKYMPPPLPYFKVNIHPFPLPHFASIFFAYL
jgi:hypothetical protein